MKEKIKFIKELAKEMNENKIDTVKYEENNFEIQLTKNPKEKKVVYSSAIQDISVQNQVQSVEANSTENVVISENVQEEITGIKVESPMVGTFYSAPSPNAEPFVKEGDSVTEGQTLCIVEAMKLMNEVKSPVSGKVKKIMAKDGDAIKKGQVLVIIEN